MGEELIEKYVEEAKKKEAYERLKNNEPVQYIIGNVDFYGYKIKVNKNVLIPRFETEELVENTIKRLKKIKKSLNILEVGTGSGCISIALLKELNNIKVTATDISKEAIMVAKENAKDNNVSINFVNTNVFDNVNNKFDVIISNPPYIKEDEEIMDIVYNNEPHIALFAPNNGLYFYEEILKNSKKVLNDKYLIAFEIGAGMANDIKSLVSKYINDAHVEIKKDMQHRDRMVFIYNFE